MKMLRHGSKGTSGTLKESSTLSSFGWRAMIQMVRMIAAVTMAIAIKFPVLKSNSKSVQRIIVRTQKTATPIFVIFDDKVLGCFVYLKFVICLMIVIADGVLTESMALGAS